MSQHVARRAFHNLQCQMPTPVALKREFIKRVKMVKANCEGTDSSETDVIKGISDARFDELTERNASSHDNK